MMKVKRLPGRFHLKNYPVPVDLEVALREGLVDNANTIPGIGNDLKQLIKKQALPTTETLNYMLLLSVEQHFENEEIQTHIFYDSPVYNEKKKCFKIAVPHLNDDNPFISGGNIVHLRDSVTQTVHDLFIVDIWKGSLNAEPIGFNKSIGWFVRNRKYVITFSLSHYTLRCAKCAIEMINSWKMKDLLLNPSNNPQTHTHHNIYLWFNPNISTNKEQKKAIHDIINKTAFPAPYILFGPPGTGKTATIVEAILQIYRLDNTKKVLVCTPANTPADDITKMLIRNNFPSNNILRLYSVSTESKLLDKEVIKCSNIYYESDNENNKKRQTMKREEIENKTVIICTLTSSLKLSALEWGPSYFSHIFIDEAAQASVPETWIPISLLVANSSTSTQVVLSGDPMQLGPVVKTKIIEHLLGVSMMERLLDLDCYKNNSKKQFFMTKLIQNYRCHSSIMKVPNKLFYNDELQYSGGSESLQGVNWKYLPNKKFPIIFHAVFGEEKKTKEHHSPFNDKEIALCLKYVQQLKEANRFKETNIGIITPFKRQETFIKNVLKNKGIFNIAVGTVQTFQGLEKDVIIVSTVRSRLLRHNGKPHMGFLSNKQRFNVSITRAKSLLIIIGNPTVLCQDEAWFELIKFCKDNNACTGKTFILQKPRKFLSEVPARPAKKQTKPSSSDTILPHRQKPNRDYLREPEDYLTSYPMDNETEYLYPASPRTSNLQKVVRPTPQSGSQFSNILNKYPVPPPSIYPPQNQIRSEPRNMTRGMADTVETKTRNQTTYNEPTRTQNQSITRNQTTYNEPTRTQNQSITRNQTTDNEATRTQNKSCFKFSKMFRAIGRCCCCCCHD